MSITCEQCGVGISSVEATHSFLIILQQVGTGTGYKYGQCMQGASPDISAGQHFYCSESHMLSSIINCIQNHYSDAILHEIVSGSTDIDKQVFAANLKCVVCGTDITSVAYRFGVDGATPYPSQVDTMRDHQLNEWCCSLAHAQQQAIKNIGAINAKVSQ